MTNVINTNVSSLVAQASLARTGRGLDRSLERLASGLRINSAADDAAGLAIANRLSAQINGLRQAVRNANDGIALAQTAEGALSESTNILLRIRDLAVQAVNDSNDSVDRANIQKEVSQLQAELNRIADTTKFSGKNLLNGTFTSQAFQVGAFANETITFSISDAGSDALGNNSVLGNTTIDNALSGVTQNGVTAQTLTISGNAGSTTVDVAANATAKSVADLVNGVQSTTSVSATARTEAVLSSFSASNLGTITIGLVSTNSTAQSISASISTNSDLSNLVDAINAQTSTTGVTARFTDATGTVKDSITLVNSVGNDIIITEFGNGDSAAATTAVFQTTDSTTSVDLSDVSTDSNIGAIGGTLTFSSSRSFTIDAGTNGTIVDSSSASTLNSVATIDVGTSQGATNSFAIIDQALQGIDDIRATLGAVQNRLINTINNLTNVANNQESARSQILDADFASETASLTKFQILQQAGISILAQSNARPQAVLSLLQ